MASKSPLRFRIDKTAKSGAWITKRFCNLACIWCHHDYFPHNGFVAIGNVQFAKAVEKVLDATNTSEAYVRIAGDGEPTLVGEEELTDLVTELRKVPQVSQVKLTTNGVLLGQMAQALKDVNLDVVTVSLNSLDPDQYYRYTRRHKLEQVLDSIDEAYRVGLNLKINVIYGTFNADHLDEFDRLSCKYNGLRIKFFDLLVQSKDDEKYYLPLERLERQLKIAGAHMVREEAYPYPKRIYKTASGGAFEVKIAGRMNNCPNRTCPVRDICLEGCRHSIRIGLDDIMRPCGVRNDNIVDLLDPRTTNVDILRALKSGGKV